MKADIDTTEPSRLLYLAEFFYSIDSKYVA